MTLARSMIELLRGGRASHLLVLIPALLIPILLYGALIAAPNGVLLPDAYPDVSHSDHELHISKANVYADSGQLYYVDEHDVSHPFMWLALAIGALGGSGALAFTVHFFAVLILFIAGVYALAWTSTRSPWAALLASTIAATNGYLAYGSFWGHSNTISFWPIPWILFAYERFRSSGSLTWPAAIGVLAYVQAISSSYAFAFLSVLFPLYVALRERRSLLEKTRRYWIGVGLAVVVFGVLIAPYAAERLSTEPQVRTIEDASYDGWRLDRASELLSPAGHLFLTPIAIILTIIAGSYALRDAHGIEHVALALASVLLMIGPIAWYLPYTWLYHAWPFFDAMRVPFRAYPFLITSASIASAMAFTKLSDRMPHRTMIVFAVALVLVLIATAMLAPWTGQLHVYGPVSFGP